MRRQSNRSIVVSEAKKEKIDQFRQELDQKLDQAIEHHEFKMVYIGIATLALFVGVIYAAWKF
jgi:50S ribosomal subunit-associated GTPase HflX